MNHSKRNIDREHARSLVAQGAQLVDVRTPQEYRDGHIAGAINVPLHELEQRVPELQDCSDALVLYCHSGRRSGSAADRLARLGFDRVYDLGAMAAW